MLPDFDDIKQLIPQDPIWYTEGGVPRYAPFHPEMLGVYDKQALLVAIACQNCGKPFLVGWGSPGYRWANGQYTQEDLEDIAKHFHYGDPPRHGCVGDTMNCIDLSIEEAWSRGSHPTLPGWVRRHRLEYKDIRQDWAREQYKGTP
jgi:hypothetical protein